MKILVIFFFLPYGIEAARIKVANAELNEHHGGDLEVGGQKENGKSHSLLEEGCKFDEPPDDNSKKLGSLLEKPEENTTAFVPATEVGPDDYWSAENALGRCLTAKSWRNTKVVLSAPVMILAGSYVLMSYHVYVDALSGMVSLASELGVNTVAVLDAAFSTFFDPIVTIVNGVLQPVINNVVVPVVTNVVVPVVNALASSPIIKSAATAVGTAIMTAVPFTTAGIVFTTMFFYLYSVVIVEFYTFAVPIVSYAVLFPFIQAFGAVDVVTSVSTDLAAKFLGQGPKNPSCCCVAGRDPSPQTCMLTALNHDVSLEGAKRGSGDRCPFGLGWTHDAGQCAVAELIAYSDQTVEGCRCVKASECSSNAPHNGHAWCEVASNCGFRMTTNPSRRWDQCRFDGKPLEFATNKSSGADDALATFIPNDFSDLTSLFVPGPDSSFALGTWVDSNRALTTAKSGWNEDSQCFAGTPMETLSACARSCLEEGAPNAKTMSKEAKITHKCVAFAYHRALHLCVRLPAFATDAEFSPHLSEWNGDGWQNFVSKYHGRDVDTVCPANVLATIRESGYAFVRDKNNGHMYVQCANNENIQKVSCLADECAYKSSWCFVNNNCRSGMPLWLGGCGRLTGSEALKCAGKHGSIIPDSGSDQADDYFSASKSLARCSNANAVRKVKAVISTFVFLWVGEFARLSVVHGGAYATYSKQVIETSFSSAQVALNATMPFFKAQDVVVGTLLNVPVVGLFLGAAWALALSAFAAIYVGSIYVIAVDSVAAAILGPLIVTTLIAQKIPEVGVDILSLLVGYGPRYPKCCCTTVPDGSSQCAVVGIKGGLHIENVGHMTLGCPTGWTNEPTECTIPEMIKYSDTKTMGGCECKNFTDCSSNTPYHGHSWCHVKGNKCGNTAWAGGGPWDYCRIEGEPLAYAQGISSTTNDALSTFIPNEFSRGDLLGPSNALRLGSWTDPNRAITTAQPGPLSLLGTRECFAAVPVETLAGCATKCLEEGAPDAADMSNKTDKKHITDKARPCVAFAYNRNLNLCVRLPAFAADAKYTPMLNEWGGEGWSNFVSKYFGLNLKSSCPAMTLLNIRDRGYAVARDKNNGHLYVRCANKRGGPTQKVSCLESECVGNGPNSLWCFVEKKCGAWGNPCKYTGEKMNDLKC